MKNVISNLLSFAIWINVKNTFAESQSGSFEYRGNVSYSDLLQLLSETGPRDVTLRSCAAECYKTLDCNAVEICSRPVGNVCRLRRSISKYLVRGHNTCTQYGMVHNCGPVSIFNRRTGKCQCEFDCDCTRATPPVGAEYPHTIQFDGGAILTKCINTAGHVWTIFQRRSTISTDFLKDWASYQGGFGDINGNFWLGLDKIRQLVLNGYTILRVELEYGPDFAYAEYSSFYIAGHEDNYRIHVSGYSGTAGDAISCTEQYCHNDAQFSTIDRDNDESSYNFGLVCRGAWWFRYMCYVHLNGRYGAQSYYEGIHWYPFRQWMGLTGTRMMLRKA